MIPDDAARMLAEAAAVGAAGGACWALLPALARRLRGAGRRGDARRLQDSDAQGPDPDPAAAGPAAGCSCPESVEGAGPAAADPGGPAAAEPPPAPPAGGPPGAAPPRPVPRDQPDADPPEPPAERPPDAGPPRPAPGAPGPAVPLDPPPRAADPDPGPAAAAGSQGPDPALPPSTPPFDASSVSRETTALGYVEGAAGRTELFAIPERDRQNIAVFGEVGSGKTSVMRLLIMQDIARGTGFLLIDPHRDFAREVLSLVPPSMRERVVYVSLASVYQFGRTVCLNPLESRTDHERYIRAAGAVSSLRQYFADGWGHRLEAILRNLMRLVMSTPGQFRFLDLISVLYDEERRAEALRSCSDPSVRDFWASVYPRFPSEAAGAVYNKFDKIIGTPPVAAMFSSPASSVSIRECIERGRFVVVDLGSASTADIVEFMGTLIIGMFGLENRIRFDLGEAARTPFNVYIDEVHMFSPEVVRDLLNGVRKYGMKATVATQSVAALGGGLGDEVDDLFRCVAMFRCDRRTASVLARSMPLGEAELGMLGRHRFAAYSHGSLQVAGVGMTRHLGVAPRWKETARLSLEAYGRAAPAPGSFGAARGAGRAAAGAAAAASPRLPPLQYYMLSVLHAAGGREVAGPALAAAACAAFARTDERAATSALADSLAGHERYASGRTEYAVGSRLDATVRMYSETALAVRSLYSSAFSGRGAGGGLHRAAISSICAAMRAHHHYAVPDLGDSARTRPDIVVHSFRPAAGRPTAREAAARRAAARRASEAAARLAGRRRTAGIRRADAARRAGKGEGEGEEEGGDDAGDAAPGADAAAAAAPAPAGPPYEPPQAEMPGGRLADPDAWSDEVLAVEVEASPSKHRKQVLANYEKAASAGMSVWFVAFGERDASVVDETLAGAGVGRGSYRITVADPPALEAAAARAGRPPAGGRPVLLLAPAQVMESLGREWRAGRGGGEGGGGGGGDGKNNGERGG